MVGRAARLIALDWGSTSLRGYLMDEHGEVMAERSSDAGASRLGGSGGSGGDGDDDGGTDSGSSSGSDSDSGSGAGEAFESALRRLAGDWLAATPDLPIVACGMVGSKHGWAEAPYMSTPAPLDQLAAHALRVETASGLRLRIIPGLSWLPPDGAPEVMRGEETQVVALLATQPALAAGCRIVLPGTHSKWVLTQGQTVQSFATYMTGELFDVLMRHSVLARTAQPGGRFDEAAFERGVSLACAHGGDLGRLLFGVRTLGLFERMTGRALADYASGLLIGSEIVSATRARGSAPGGGEPPIRVVGADVLVARYSKALDICGCQAQAASISAASGIWMIAKQGGWLG